MGWNDWSYYQCDMDEQTILGNARALVSSGLAAKGYDTVTTDDCWMAKTRDSAGDLVPDPVKFPDGMAYVGSQLHAMGLKFGIYEDAGTSTCGGFPGSLDHWQQDADLFAKWQVDYVKLDGCNVPTKPGETDEQSYHDTYSAWSQAMLDTGRPMVFSVSAPAYFQGTDDWDKVIGWSAQVGNLWREGADVALGQESGAAKWSSLLYNYSYNAGLADLQSPGRWNDPDFLLAGDSGLSRRRDAEPDVAVGDDGRAADLQHRPHPPVRRRAGRPRQQGRHRRRPGPHRAPGPYRPAGRPDTTCCPSSWPTVTARSPCSTAPTRRRPSPPRPPRRAWATARPSR